MATVVYIIGVVGLAQPIKIGISNGVRGRLKSLQLSSPFPLELRYQIRYRKRDLAYQIEQEIHARLADCRSHGEWFDCDVETAVSHLKSVRMKITELRVQSNHARRISQGYSPYLDEGVDGSFL